MGEVIRFVPKSEREPELALFEKPERSTTASFPPSDPVREQRDKASASHMRIGADVHRGGGGPII